VICRRLVLAFSALAMLTLIAPAFATETPFTTAAFQGAQKAGKPILVEVHASWCPTCKAQMPIIGKLTAEPAFKDMVVLRVDFDDQKNIVREFGAQTQSTLIVYKGDKEVGRSVGDTNADSIAELLEKSL
jgi:thioredoxin 1